MSALTEALVAAQAELPTAIERDAQGLGYRYTSLDKLIEATRPILTKHGISITQWPTTLARAESEGRQALVPALATRITHATSDTTLFGSVYGNNVQVSDSIEYVMPLYLDEPKGMQSLGAAITYGRRYAWAAALGIASEEDTDAATLKPDEEEIPF